MDGRPSRWTSRPYSFAAADALTRDLGVSRTVASVLVRRGCDTPEAARAFLDPRDRHDALLLGDMAEACRAILGHLARGSRIVVHGDYDVDGVCATALLVRALRALGADAGWHIPSRFDEGYGLAHATVERLASEGAGLIVTVDCGITAVDEVRRARELGVDIVVSDHHKPGDALPDCPRVHPGLGGYPDPNLCGTAVAHKLALALVAAADADPQLAERDLDLVALATLCDLVPLIGENRRIAREGLAVLRHTRNVGLRALMEVAGLAPADCDERAAGFRLGPRINAAGRMQRADAALELLMTDDAHRAAAVARELDDLNRERQDEELRIVSAAEAAAARWAHAPAIVVAGDGWHPGVVGIVASRLVERHGRPAVVLSIEQDGARGSGRSISAFDLHAGLAAAAEHLTRFGGHRMAAGLELDADRIDAFRAAFTRHAASVLTPDDLVPREKVDAVASGGAAGLSLAEELDALGPFGPGNPAPTLLLPAARLESVRAMGDEKQHARLTVRSGGARIEAVAFRASAAALNKLAEEQHDLAVRLERNEWNGSVAPRLVLRAICPPQPGTIEFLDEEPDFWEGVARSLDAHAIGPWTIRAAGPAARALVDRRGDGAAAVAADLLTSGEPVLLLCADVARRRESLERLLAGIGRLAVGSWDAFADDPSLAAAYPHLIAMDPPPVKAGEVLLECAPAAESRAAYAHLAWGAPEIDFALAVARASFDLRPAVTGFYRTLRDAGTLSGVHLRAALAGDGRHPRPPAVAARLIRVLDELGLASFERAGSGPAATFLAVDGRRDLAKSSTFAACAAVLVETERYLRRGDQPARRAA
ncbi:MAG: single-stranded-DNA-specific exonuclease RecJ [Thermoleophilaceae bacterium]